MNVIIVFSDLLLVLFCIIMLFGLHGMFRFKTTWCKTLNSSKMDSAAVIILMVALMLRTGFSNMTPKLFVILLFYLLTNPISNQLVLFAAKRKAEKEDA